VNFKLLALLGMGIFFCLCP